jgi:dTDP-4-amino-4,6-dideoxygalactose transaminase
MEKRIYLASPNMGGSELKYIQEAFDTNWLSTVGKNIDEFEKTVCAYTGMKFGVGLSNGTAALHLSLKYLGVQQNDYVLCQSLTFAASCNPVVYEKGKLVFIDSDPTNWNMSPVALKKALESLHARGIKPKAVIAVNLYGQSADYDPIIALCKEYDVPLIEDAAESLGATYKGKPSGSLGFLNILSFNGNKIITTTSGGMVLTNDEETAKKIKFWSTQSREPFVYYLHKELGYNYRLSNVLAGIGRGQMEVLDLRVSQKKKIFDTYKEAFKDIKDIEMMPIALYGTPNYWLSCFTLKPKSKVSPIAIIKLLSDNNIESRPIWNPMHLQPFYSGCEYFKHSNTDIAGDIFTRGVCLPSDTNMTSLEQQEVIKFIKSLF